MKIIKKVKPTCYDRGVRSCASGSILYGGIEVRHIWFFFLYFSIYIYFFLGKDQGKYERVLAFCFIAAHTRQKKKEFLTKKKK